MQDLVRVCVADTAQDARVGERALQRVIALAQARAERGEIGPEHFHSAAIVVGELRLAREHMQRRATFRAGFGERQRAVGEFEREERGAHLAAMSLLIPVEPAGDHEMDEDPPVAFEADRNPLADPAQREDRAPFARLQRRIRGTQQKRILENRPLQPLPGKAPFERLDIRGDVGQLGHL
jgi:hypothetical protein